MKSIAYIPVLMISLILVSSAEARRGCGRSGFGFGFSPRFYSRPVYRPIYRPVYRPVIVRPIYASPVYGYGGGYDPYYDDLAYQQYRRARSQRRVRNTLLGVGVANELFNRGHSRRLIRGASLGGLILNGIFR